MTRVRLAGSMSTPSILPTTHTVVSGDTLSGIAQTYNRTLADLLRWNPINDPNQIQVGQVINVADSGEDLEYTVVEGDTVSELAQRFGKRWIDIAAVNRLDDINLITVGQKLIIPAQGVAR
ncbi:LysM domain/M23/M37 peptidase domain protein [Janibacter sp. HTCC2649]|nr:LysM domain/M23/M37 peptidase domain protein [Janibacter sp. HTCC2649]